MDLNHPNLLAQDGLPPSEGTPQFHQQMVYAVAMTTIANFEQALGRRALWAPRLYDQAGDRIKDWSKQWVRRLRIYPHALREANAYYSPEKKALLFGYFPAPGSDSPGSLPGGTVFTSLSHDIIAHETTHALLDGLHRRFNEPTNPDVLAFHEAFSDIVALFQHFTFPEAICHQIARTRGDLNRQNLLGALALQFGQALGNHGALRDAIGSFRKGKWVPKKPNPDDYESAEEPHARGAILVAAVFDAFLSIYRHRIADLMRIASGGTGVLPRGELHPDLVNRLAGEASKAARHVLHMCIRALDYCPPVDITFGEYLRAVVTADYDLVPDDKLGYRVAVVEAFRRRGIYPREVRTLSPESLRWHRPDERQQKALHRILPSSPDSGAAEMPGSPDLRSLDLDWNLTGDREHIFYKNNKNAKKVKRWIEELKIDALDDGYDVARIGQLIGLKLGDPNMNWEVHSVRPARRSGPDGYQRLDWIIEITQRRPMWFDESTQNANERAYHSANEADPGRIKPDFYFRGGCTLVVDGETADVRYVIAKNILNEHRLERERAFRAGSGTAFATYFTDEKADRVLEPFALLHGAP